MAWLVIAAWALVGCAAPERDRVVVLALDGVDPDALEQLIDRGRLPNLARMREEGAYGRLRSMRPLWSPVVWTTIATGRTADVHGITDFVLEDASAGERVPASSTSRRVRALWNIASAHERSVAVVGWWATWPAEEVRGHLVSDRFLYHFLFKQGMVGEAKPSPRRTYPESLEATLEPLVVRAADVDHARLSNFAEVEPAELDRPFDFEDELWHLRWAIAAATTHARIGLHLWREERPELLMVYVEAPDSVSHLFGHLFGVEGLGGPLAEQQRRFGHAVEETYREADRIVGELLREAGPRTTTIVLSDHGFALGHLPNDPSFAVSAGHASASQHRMDGVILLHGHRVKPGHSIRDAGILDVAPTVLSLLGIPPSTEMPGRVRDDALELPEIARVASHEPAAGEPRPSLASTREDAAVLERLESLGYLAGSNEVDDASRAPSRAERSMAAILFHQGRVAESLAAYASLVERDPDDAELRTALGGLLGSLGRHEAALAHLDQAVTLDPVSATAYYNRGLVHERRGDTQLAIEDYARALQCSPQHEPSLAAFARLAAPPDSSAVAALLDTAEDAARSGRYADASRALDEAERLAPDDARVWHYRANVAYLEGDTQRAIEAVRRALALEPDNPVLRENLRRLGGLPQSGPSPQSASRPVTR